jgi:predicted acylesterase/phospholipase RssA
VLTRSFRLGENEITRDTIKLNPPEILIQPAVGNIMTLEFYRGKEAIEAGREAVQEKREELEALMNYEG